MIKDFLGQPITVGCFVASGGKGNTVTEYGMILHKVVAVEPKLKLQRLTVDYPRHTVESTVASARTATGENPQKYVVVQPPQAAIDLFEAVVAGTATRKQQITVGKWVHGQTQVFP